MKIQITDKTPRVLIAVYGTLRSGQGNWNAILRNNAEYLGSYSTDPYFTMYSNGAYPTVCDFGTTSVEYEVFQITSNDVLNDVHALEGSTGIPNDPKSWYDIMPIETPHGRAYMYVQHEPMNLPVVESGNWLMRYLELENQDVD